jgi:hypothetical protein
MLYEQPLAIRVEEVDAISVNAFEQLEVLQGEIEADQQQQQQQQQHDQQALLPPLVINPIVNTAQWQPGVVQPLPPEPEAIGARVTLFTLPRSMYGEAAVRQKIAIASWLKLRPRPYILLMGEDPGVGEYAQEIGVTWVPDIAKNQYGTPLISSCWEKAHQLAPTRTRVFINTDIVMFASFTEAVAVCEERYTKDFFMSGQRTTVKVKPESIDLTDRQWLERLYKQSFDPRIANGDSLDAVDYFVFTSGLLHDIPPFAIGRYTWDSWIVHHLVATLVDTVDATEVVRIAHLAHEVHNKMTGNSQKDVLQNPEVIENRRLAGKMAHMGNLQHFWDALVPCNDDGSPCDASKYRFKTKHRRWRKNGKKFITVGNVTVTAD